MCYRTRCGYIVAKFGFDGYVDWLIEKGAFPMSPPFPSLPTPRVTESVPFNKTKKNTRYHDWRRDGFFITSISTEMSGWQTTITGLYAATARASRVGGCQQIIKEDDVVLFAYATHKRSIF